MRHFSFVCENIYRLGPVQPNLLVVPNVGRLWHPNLGLENLRNHRQNLMKRKLTSATLKGTSTEAR
jgi:hypothetical protein